MQSVDLIPPWLVTGNAVYDLFRGEGFVDSIERDINGNWIVTIEFRNTIPMISKDNSFLPKMGKYDIEGYMFIPFSNPERTLYPLEVMDQMNALNKQYKQGE